MPTAMSTSTIKSFRCVIRHKSQNDNKCGITYNTIIDKYQIVIDTNVFVSALQSNQGASFQLLMPLGNPKFDLNISIPLILEYEEIAKRLIDQVIDYVCKVSNHHEIFFLWRPFLQDPDDDMVLELAVSSESNYIVTYNQKDFLNINQFGLKAITPKDFLQVIGELS